MAVFWNAVRLLYSFIEVYWTISSFLLNYGLTPHSKHQFSPMPDDWTVWVTLDAMTVCAGGGLYTVATGTVKIKVIIKALPMTDNLYFDNQSLLTWLGLIGNLRCLVGNVGLDHWWSRIWRGWQSVFHNQQSVNEKIISVTVLFNAKQQ